MLLCLQPYVCVPFVVQDGTINRPLTERDPMGVRMCFVSLLIQPCVALRRHDRHGWPRRALGTARAHTQTHTHSRWHAREYDLCLAKERLKGKKFMRL